MWKLVLLLCLLRLGESTTGTVRKLKAISTRTTTFSQSKDNSGHIKSRQDNSSNIVKKVHCSAEMADAFSKSNYSLKAYEVTNGSYEYKAKGQGYLLPKACVEDGVVLISSCLTDSETEDLPEIRHWWLSIAQNVHTKDSDETNYFPVTDLTTGYTYTNWSVFTCFAHLCSKPLIWKAYLKELKIQTKKSYIYAIVEYQRLLFEQPKDQVRISWCQKRGTDIPDKTFETLMCPQCKNAFYIYNETLNYTIHVFPSMNDLSFKSSVKSNPWTRLRCKIQSPNVSTQVDNISSCIITSYESNLLGPVDKRGAKAYVLKLGFSESNFDVRTVELFTQALICTLRQYANVNAVRSWRPTVRIYSPEVKDYFFVIKLLVHDYFISLNGRRREILKIFFKIIKTLFKNNKIFMIENGDYSFERPGMEGIGEDLDLPELDNVIDFHELATTNFICGCSVTLKELFTFKYLQHWLCELKCETFDDDRKNSTDDVIGLMRMCIMGVNESAGFYYHIDVIVLSVCVFCMLALNEH